MTITARAEDPIRERPGNAVHWGTHSTYGTYIAGVTINGLTFECEPCELFRASIDRASDKANLDVLPADFTVTSDGSTITATWKTDPRIVFTFTVTIEADAIAFGQALNSTSTTYSVKTFDFPSAQFKLFGQAGRCYATMAHHGGCVVKGPQNFTASSLVAPLSMQFASMYDSGSRAQIYFATDDDEGCRKVIYFEGKTTAVRWSMRHEVDRRYVPGSDFNRPYKFRMKAFVGRTRDGRLGCYDAAHEYRKWATNAGRPWMSRGPWATASGYSTRVKNSDVLFWWPGNSERGFTRKTNIVTRLMTLAGLSDMIATPYWWVQQAFYAPAVDNPSIGTMQSDYLTFLATAQALGCHVQDYVNHRFLDSQLLSGPFNMSAYAVSGLGTIDVRTRCLRDRTGALVFTDTGTGEGAVMMSPDYARSDWTSIAYQFLFDYAVAHAGAGSAGPHGIYQDSFGANLGDYQDDPTQSSWTYRASQAGRKAVISTILAGFRGADPQFFMSQEYPEEMMVDVFDLYYTGTIEADANGKFVDLFSYVYGRYVRTGQYLWPQVIDATNGPASNLPLQQVMDASWLRSGIASFDDATTSSGAELIAASPSPANTPLFYLFDWMRVLHAARPRTIANFQGSRMPPLPHETWEGDWIDASETSFQQFWVGVQTNSVTRSGVFKQADGTLGIIVIHEYPAGVYGDPGPQVVTLEIDSTIYELAAGTQILYERTNAGLAEIVRFTNELSWPVTMQSGTVRTFEVRPA